MTAQDRELIEKLRLTPLRCNLPYSKMVCDAADRIEAMNAEIEQLTNKSQQDKAEIWALRHDKEQLTARAEKSEKCISEIQALAGTSSFYRLKQILRVINEWQGLDGGTHD
jgi:FtsZ-binding cell division protein ZapB